MPEHEISMGREGIQHWTQARPVQRNITSGGSEARHLGGSVNQKVAVLIVIDVRRGSFYAKAKRRVYIELPEGDGGGPGIRQCGLLRKSLYAPVTPLKTGSATLGDSWRRLVCARDKRARAKTPKRRGESALRSMVMMHCPGLQGRRRVVDPKFQRKERG